MPSPFPGPTSTPNLGAYNMAFGPDGSLWMQSEGGIAVHRSGSKASETVAGPEGGGTKGLSVAGDRVLASGSGGAVLYERGKEISRFAVENVASGVLDASGERVAIGDGWPGGYQQSIHVFAADGTVIGVYRDHELRNVTGAFRFDERGTSLVAFATGSRVELSTAGGDAQVGPEAREGFFRDASRVEALPGALLAIFAGRGAVVKVAALAVDNGGRQLWAIEGEADAVAANREAGLVAVVRQGVVEVLDLDGRKLRQHERKATHSVDAAVVSRDGWLAISGSGRSGSRAKKIEFVQL